MRVLFAVQACVRNVDLVFRFSVSRPIGKHGFARNSMWSLFNSAMDTATFELESSAGNQGFSHAFRCLYTVSIIGEGKIETSMQAWGTTTAFFRHSFKTAPYGRRRARSKTPTPRTTRRCP